MKFVLITITIFNLSAFQALASCLVNIYNGGRNYHAVIWKHTEGQDDEVQHKSLSSAELKNVTGMIGNKKGMRFIFNDGVFTSMDYIDGETRKWAQLSRAEKDVIFFIQEKFDVTEK